MADAASYAVICPFKGLADTPDELIKHIYSLIDLRRSLFSKFRVGGVLQVASAKDWSYLLNCPPINVRTKQRSRVCNKIELCPFCWGRERVIETYKAVTYALYGTFRSKQFNCQTGLLETVLPRPYDFMEVISTWKAPFAGQDLKTWLASTLAERRKFLQKIPAKGTFALSVLEPSKDHWLLSTRILAMIPIGYVPDVNSKTEEDYTLSVKVQAADKKVLAAILGRVARYPVGLFDRSVDDKRIAEAMEARKGLRLSALTGLFRNHSERLRNSQIELPARREE